MPEIRPGVRRAARSGPAPDQAELASSLSAHARKPRTRAEPQGLARLFSRARNKAALSRGATASRTRNDACSPWQRKAEGANDPLARAAYGVLVRLAGAILIQHGRLRGGGRSWPRSRPN